MKALRGLDPMVYLRALGLLVRNPVIIVVPLLMGVLGVFVSLVSGGGIAGSFMSQIEGFILLLLNGFAFGTATILADQAWRRGKTSFDEGWVDARRKSGEIIMATIGFTFVIFIAQFAAQLLGGLFGGGFLQIVLMLAAVYFLIYTIPAAAIGGVPGGAAISVSIERARANPLPTAIVTIVAVLAYLFVSPQIAGLIFGLVGPFAGDSANLVASLAGALGQSIALSYVAIVLAKTYEDAALRPPWMR
jgi:hypothetical protein